MTTGMLFGPDMPHPQADELTRPFWEAVQRQELIVQRCRNCGTHRHTPKWSCAKCQSEDYDWERSLGRGTIFTYTIVHRSVHAGTAGITPYNCVVVELDDCGRVLVTGNVVGIDLSAMQVGLAVVVCWEVTADGWVSYRFRPEDTEQRAEVSIGE